MTRTLWRWARAGLARLGIDTLFAWAALHEYQRGALWLAALFVVIAFRPWPPSEDL